MLTYTVILTPELDGSAINVTVPALPGVLTWGGAPEEARPLPVRQSSSTSKATSSAGGHFRLTGRNRVTRHLPFLSSRPRQPTVRRFTEGP